MNTNWIRFIAKEAQFIKSLSDLNRFCQKFPFMVPRLLGWGHTQSRVPLTLQIEPTNICNVRCICCSRDQMKRKHGFMDFNLFKKIIDDASVLKIRRVFLYLHGEPLLHPQIDGMVRYIKDKQIGLTLTTNGMLLDADKIDSLLHAGVDNSDHIIFSILGYSKAVHEKIMVGVHHETVVSNLFQLVESRKKLGINGPVIEAVIYAMRENKHEIELFNKYWDNVVDHIRDVGEISEQFANSGDRKQIPQPRKKSCNNVWERMTILWNGDVTVCIADINGSYVIGNVAEYSIKEIWNCQELTEIRKLHIALQFEKLNLCANCDW